MHLEKTVHHRQAILGLYHVSEKKIKLVYRCFRTVWKRSLIAKEMPKFLANSTKLYSRWKTPADPSRSIIDDLHIFIVGVQNLMNDLNCKKANGPDKLPIRVFKETAA